MDLKLIAVLSIAHILIDMTASALPAIMPLLQSSLALSYTEIGATVMVANLTSSVIQPCLGYFSDRTCIGWLLPASVVLAYGSFSLIGLLPSYVLLLLFVGLSGVGVAMFHPESFKLAHHFVGARAATGMSIFQVGGNFGLAVGPLCAAFAVQAAGLRGTLLFLLPGLAVLGVLLWFNAELTRPLRDTQRVRSNARVLPQPSPQGRGAWLSMTLLVIAVTLRSWAHMGLMTFIPFYYTGVLHGPAAAAGKPVFAFLIGGAAGTLAGGMASDRIGHKRFFGLSLVCSVPLLFLFLHVSGTWAFIVLFLAGFVLISSFSVTVVMGQTILSNRLGIASGLMLGFVIGMGGIGAGWLGFVADTWGIVTTFRLIAIMPALALLPLSILRYNEKTNVRVVAR